MVLVALLTVVASPVRADATAVPAAPAEPPVAPCHVEVAEFAGSVDRALVAYVERDATRFGEAAEAARAMVSCLAGTPDAGTAARFHLVSALALVAWRDREGAIAEMRALPAGFSPPSSLVPPGQFVAGMFADAAAMPARERVPVRPLAPVAATAVSAAIGLGGLGLGLANRAAFDDPATPYGEIAAIQERSLLYTGMAAGGAVLTAAGATWWAVAW